MKNLLLIYFVHFAVRLTNRPFVVSAIYDNQARIYTATKGLILEAAYDRNVTLRLSRNSTLLINGIDITRKIIQRYTPTTLDSVENKPPFQEISKDVQKLASDIDRLLNQFMILRHPNYSRFPLDEIGRNIRVLDFLHSRIQYLLTNLQRNECEEILEPCKNGGTCYDAYQGFHCECTAGWMGKTCEEDVNECLEFTGTDLGCQNNATCVNTLGGYRCDCAKGYAGVHCHLQSAVCQHYQSDELCEHGICVPASNHQGYTCVCNQGWSRNFTANPNSTDALTCNVDVNECEESKNPCHWECVNIPGSFKCGPCPAGYTGNGVTCVDVDECITYNGGCSLLPQVRCINTEGSYRCGNCPHGWKGDGHTCEVEVSNSCDSENICHTQAKCEYISDMATCTCPYGMSGHGFGPNGCHNISITDTCQNHTCMNNGLCVTIRSNSSCICPLGYHGALCETADGCHPNPCENDGTCKPFNNQSFKCTCPQGTTGTRCERISSLCNSIQGAPMGELSYPSYDNSEYSNLESCTWLIRTTRMNILNITFIKFNVQEDPDCNKDWLEVHDGNSLNSQLIGRFCGHELPLGGTIISSTNQVFFRFRSDNATNGVGFHLTWQSQPHTCGESLAVGIWGEGLIRSPGFPSRTSSNTDCLWDLKAPYGYRFIIRIYSIVTGTRGNCTGDTLKIYDSDILLEQFCTTVNPASFKSSSNNVIIQLHTDSLLADTLFQLHYEVEPSVQRCGGEFTEPSGCITGLTTGTVCTFLIHQIKDTKIRLDIVQWQPFEIDDCHHKNVEVFDGSTVDAPLLVFLCNETLVYPVVSSSNPVLIRYRNNLQINAQTPAFVAKYSRVCELSFYGPDSGEFTTPNYPQAYMENITCTFVINGPPETVVHANFIDFSIDNTKLNGISSTNEFLTDNRNNETTNNNNLNDEFTTYVEVYLSESNKERFLESPRIELISELNRMTISFHASLNPNNERGFRVAYSFEHIICGGVYTEPKGYFGRGLERNDACKFIFEAPRGKQIHISFGMIAFEGITQVLIYGNETGSAGHLLKNISNLKFFEQTFEYEVITVIIARHTYLLDAEYEFLKMGRACGGNFTNLYGVIESPSWPKPYEANLDCVWSITAPLGNKIELTVKNFTLESDCSGDALEIRNGMLSDSPLIGRYCGNEIPSRISSFSNSLYLRFTSDNKVEAAGFHLAWEQTETGCGGRLTSFKGSIHAPLGASKRAEQLSDVTCDWTIHVSQGSSIVITITPEDEVLSFCHSNRLKIFDGLTPSHSWLQFNCSDINGLDNQIVLASSSNEVLVVYTTWSESNRDFILDYETNCNVILDPVQGVIESPNFPDLYPESLNCNWDIKAGKKNQIKLAFSHFSLEAENMECEFDYVEIFDMKNEDVLHKHSFCSEIPSPLTSQGNRMIVHFVTNYGTGKNGFHAEYSRVGCGELLRKDSDSIESPNNPFSIDLDCEWYIEVPLGQVIVFTVLELKIDTYTQDCSTDVLTIKDTKYSTDILFRECSTLEQTRSTVTSRGNRLYVHFRTGPFQSRKYFKAEYTSRNRACGGDLSVKSGLISSPKYPLNTTQDVLCQWSIYIPENFGIVLELKDFNIKESQNCSDAYLKVTNKSGRTGTVLMRACGSHQADIDAIRTNELEIEYMNKAGVGWGKFALEFSRQCGHVINDGTGVLSSQASDSCVWMFNLTEGSLISLNILKFECYCSQEMGLGAKNCSNFLAILDAIGDDPTANIGSMFCEKHQSHLVYEKSVLYVMATNINFHATYSTVQHSCGGTIQSPQGTLASPYYPASYPPGVDCIWTVQANKGHSMQIDIEEMDIASSPYCNEDFLVISEFQNRKTTHLGVFCGKTLPDDAFVSNKLIKIRFHSSAGNTGRGFKLNWSYAHFNQIQNTTEGIIEPPPLQMAKNDEEPYTWRILVSEERNIVIIFDDYVDGLKLYDGFDEIALPVSIAETPWRFESSSNVVFLETDNDKLQYFRITWKIATNEVINQNSTVSECHSELFIKYQALIVLTSPGYPNGYAPNMKCDWIFKPENSLHHISAVINEANLEASSNCMADYLKISSSSDLVQWFEMKKVCRILANPLKSFTVLRGTPYMKFDFVSDALNNGTGFSAFLSAKCGSNLTDSVGFINAEDIVHETDCLWGITVRPNKRIRLQFDFVTGTTRNSNECLEYAFIYDGIDYYAPLLSPGKICNPQNVSRLLINSTSNSVTIKYNLMQQKPFDIKRWNLTYREYSECNEEYHLIMEASTINISSPNYPDVPQPYSECEWRVWAPKGHVMQVEFIDSFDMNGKYCSLEYVELFDGTTSLANSLGRFCERPFELKTTQNVIFMHYQSNIPEPRSGFKARISITKCGGSFTEEWRIIKSPGYPGLGLYPSWSQCDYVINVPSDVITQLVVKDISLPFNRDNLKLSDFLEIIQIGNDIEPILLYGNTTVGSDITLTANKTIIRFHTFGKNTEYRGFFLRFDRVHAPKLCNHDIQQPSGHLAAHFPNVVYSNRDWCDWKITVPKGQKVKIEFLNLNELREYNSTRYPTISIYNDHEKISPLHTIDVGAYIPSAMIFTSTDNLMTVRIKMPSSDFMKHIIRANFTSDEISPCPVDIGEYPKSGMIDIRDTQEFFKENYYCRITTFLSGKETLVFNITSFEHTRNYSVYSAPSPLLFTDRMLNTDYKDNLTLGLQPLSQPRGYVHIIQSEHDHIHHLRMAYRRHECGGHVEVKYGYNIADLKSPAASYVGYGSIMCFWTLEKNALHDHFATNVMLQGSYNFSDTCDREYVLIQEDQWKKAKYFKKICRDSGNMFHNYALHTGLTFVFYFAEDYHHEKSNISIQIMPAIRCGGVTKVDSGLMSRSIEIHADFYKNNHECTWVFYATPGFNLQVEFYDNFFIEDSSNCTKDYLEVQGLDRGTWRPEGRFCGRQKPDDFKALAQRIQVVWHTDGNITADGFTFYVRSHCSLTLNVTSTIQRIESPIDRHGSTCVYQFQSNETDKLISVRIKVRTRGLTEIENRYSHEPFEYYMRSFVATKLDENGTEHWGYLHTEDEYEEKAYRYLKLTNEYTHLTWYTIEYGFDSCGGNITTSPTTIRSLQHEEDNRYAANMNCIWIIKAPSNHSIAIRFKYFDMKENSDHLTIYSGSKIEATKRHTKLTGNYTDEPPTVLVEDNEVVINSLSDVTTSGKGFEAQIVFLQNCNEQVKLTKENSIVNLTRTLTLNKNGEYIKCAYRITAPTGHRVGIVLKNIEIKNPSFYCAILDDYCRQECNTIEVSDSAETQLASMQKFFCKTFSSNTTLISSYDDALIEFHAKHSGIYQFEIILTMEKSECGEVTDYKLGKSEVIKLKFPQNGESAYAANVHCIWIFQSDYGMNVHFNYMDLQNVSQVTGKCLDYIQLQGPYQFNQYCGKARNFSTNLDRDPDTELTIIFHSDDTVQDRGIELVISTRGACNKTYNQLSGFIEYEGLQTEKDICNDTIIVPENYTLNLHISSMIFSDSNCDELHFRITDLKTKQVLFDRCQSSYVNIEVVRSTNAVRIEVKNFMSIKLFYTASRDTTAPGCGATLTSSTGHFSNPPHDNDGNFSECRWDIIVPAPNKIAVHLNAFNRGSSIDCNLDNVQLINVLPDGTEQIFKTFCGPEAPNRLISASNHMILASKKSANSNGIGWNVHYSMENMHNSHVN